MPPRRKRIDPVQAGIAQLEKWKSVLACFLVLAVFIVQPLIITNSYYNITATKLYCFVTIISLTVLLLGFSFLFARATIPGFVLWRGLGTLLRSIRPYEYALLAWWLVMIVSAVFSNYPFEAVFGSSQRNEGLLMMTGYFLAVVITGRLYQPKERDLFIFCIVAALVCVYGVFQYYGMDFLGIAPRGLSNAQGPALIQVSTMSNRNVLSTYACLAFSVSSVFFCKREKFAGWPYLVMGWIIFYMLILGQTESGYVGLLVSFSILLPFLASTPKCAARLLWMLSGCVLLLRLSVAVHFTRWAPSFWTPFAPFLLPAALVLAAIGALLYFLPGLPSQFPKKAFRIAWYSLLVVLMISTVAAIPRLAQFTDHKAVQAANEILQGNSDDSLGSNRMFIWKRTLTMIPQRLLLGHGQDTFYPEFLAVFGDEARERDFVLYDKAHNEYLQTLFDAGLLGLLCMLSFYTLSLLAARRQLKDPPTLGVFLALCGFLVQAFFNFSTPFAHPSVWVMWGVLAAQVVDRK